MNKLFRALGALVLLSMLGGCGALRHYTTDFFSMDTFMSLNVWANSEAKAQALAVAAEQRINKMSASLSRHDAAGSLYSLNAANGQAVTLDDDAYAALVQAVKYAELTDGIVDPTIGTVTALWGIGTDAAAIPAQAALDEALRHVGYQNIELLGDNRARLKNGAQLDMGSIGKGYATDVVSQMHEGFPFLVTLGGNIGAYGDNPRTKDGSWSVGIADPDNNAGYIAKVAVHNESVVTAGDYERFFLQDGVRYHHIFDPKTGYPAQTGLRSVTIVDSSSTRADGLDTALFVMGLDKGLAFCADQGIEAVFITADHKIYATAGLQSRLTLAEGVDYALVR